MFSSNLLLLCRGRCHYSVPPRKMLQTLRFKTLLAAFAWKPHKDLENRLASSSRRGGEGKLSSFVPNLFLKQLNWMGSTCGFYLGCRYVSRQIKCESKFRSVASKIICLTLKYRRSPNSAKFTSALVVFSLFVLPENDELRIPRVNRIKRKASGGEKSGKWEIWASGNERSNWSNGVCWWDMNRFFFSLRGFSICHSAPYNPLPRFFYGTPNTLLLLKGRWS